MGSHINTFHQAHIVLLGYLACQANDSMAVGLVHSGEAWAKLVVVLATQGVIGEEVDVVGDEHNISYAEVGVHTTGCIAHTQHLNAYGLHHSNGECGLFHRVALIVMETALHCHYILLAKHTKNELSLVSLNCANGEIGNLAIGNSSFYVNFISQVSKARA